MALTDKNNGPHVENLVDEGLTTAKDLSSQTPGNITTLANSGTTGLSESVTDFDFDFQGAIDSIPDISLTSGINTDDVFSLTGNTNPFGDLSISQLPSELSGLFGGSFDIDSIVDQFGIGALLGNIPLGINTDVAPKLDPKDNVLHEYATYTYRLTMGAQDPKDHQLTASSNFTTGTPKITTMIMASGGGQQVDGVFRDPIFEEDFYVEDLKMTTIIGSNAQGNGSNSVSIEFKIYEPYGASLIERLITLADKLNYPNYIEIPFVFKIEFIGYDDAGNQIGLVPNTTKYIPFRLTYMKFIVDGMGSRYDCVAIPVNHLTFNQTVTAIPEGIEVAAGTLDEFFNGKKIPVGDGSNSIGGLVNAVNNYHAKLARTTGVDTQKESPARNAADEIEIILHRDIGQHKLTVANLSKVGMLKEGFAGNPHMDPTKPTYGFQPGSAITAIIETMIKESSFMTEQIEENERIEQANAANAVSVAEGRIGAQKCPQSKNPLISFKTTATYTMLEYDPKANRHAYKATYHVMPYATAGQQSPSVSRSEIENIAKEYDYLFTGQNQDIIDLDIKFDLAFFNNVTSNTESVSEGTPSGNNKKVTGNDPGDCPPQQSDPLTQTTLEARPPPATDNTGTSTRENAKKMKANALMKSIMQSSKGDMITLDLTILGDPAFIKQDDILYAPDGSSAAAHTFNGSIKQDNGDMYLRLRFKTFDDIDHDTGLRVEGRQIPDSKFTRVSTFDGFYRIIMINNMFEGGNFTQSLTVIRTYTQETDEPESNALTNIDSNLISYGADASGLGEFGDTAIANASSALPPQISNLGFDAREASIAGATGVVDGLTPAQAADEAKALAGDFYAGQTPIDAGEFAGVDESLIPGNLTIIPTAESITNLTLLQPINADRNSRRGR